MERFHNINEKATLLLKKDSLQMQDLHKNEKQSQRFAVGKCLQMCPIDELKMREKEGLIDLLETDPSRFTEKRIRQKLKADPKRTVKCYHRSAAGMNLQNTNNLRPPHVLSATVTYLLTEVIDDRRQPWYSRYAFISDRLRAVKQDMIIQQPKATECVEILEPMVRFYLVSAYCEKRSEKEGGEKNSQLTSEFCPVLNKKQLNECLKYLLSLYDEVVDVECPARPQMEALYQLLYLGDTDALLRGIALPQRTMSEDLQCALKLSIAWYNKQYATVLLAYRTLSLLLQMAFSLSLPMIRRYALDVMSSAYSSKNLHYPLESISNLFLFRNCEEAKQCCQHYGVKVAEDKVFFLKGTFCREKSEISPACVEYVDEGFKLQKLCNLMLNSAPVDERKC